MIDLNKKRSTREWQNLLNSVKVSDLDFDTKSKLINEIQCKMTGSRNTNIEALKQIEAGMPDLNDIN